MTVFLSSGCGTQFDASTATSAMDNDVPTYTPRQRERRQAFGELLGALTRGLDRRSDVSLMRGAFEEMLRRVVPVRSIHLRELSGRWSRSEGVQGTESIALEV